MCQSALPHCDKILERNKSARDKLCLGSWFQSFSPCLLGFLTVTSGASERHGNSNMLWKREHQGNRGGQRIWEQDMGTERGSIDHVPSLDLGVCSARSSSDESIDKVGAPLIQSVLNGSSPGKWTLSTRTCGEQFISTACQGLSSFTFCQQGEYSCPI